MFGFTSQLDDGVNYVLVSTFKHNVAMDVVIAPGGKCTESAMLNHVQISAEGGLCQIDLGYARFCDPFGLVSLASIVDRAIGLGEAVEFVSPKNVNVCSYLARMNFGQFLEERNIGHALGQVRHHNTGDRLVELTRFSGPDEADQLSLRALNLFKAADVAAARALAAALDEVTLNVVTHSKKDYGFLALQTYVVGGRLEVAFAVSDSGRGLRAALMDNPDLAVPDDSTAVRLAVRRRISSDGRDSGVGLSSVLTLASSRDGYVDLWSGDASGRFYSLNRRNNPTRSTTHLQGTLVHGRMVVK